MFTTSLLLSIPALADGGAMCVPFVSLHASRLDNPRGITFGPDGNLYVAEAGTGGSRSTEGLCPQIEPPVGPFRGGDTGRISKISPAGVRTTVASGLPSTQMAATGGGDVGGVTAVGFKGPRLFALLQSGCNKGNPDVPSSVIEVNADGTWVVRTDLSAYYNTNAPPMSQRPEDFDPEGMPHAMLISATDDEIYVLEANHGRLDKVTPSGNITTAATFFDQVGHVVPTAITAGPDGNLYVGAFGLFPYYDGSASIYKVTSTGVVLTHATGMTTVMGVQFDSQGRLLVLEASTNNPGVPPYLVHGSGRVRRQTATGGWETIVSGLTMPSSMLFGPDGKLYIANVGFGVQNNSGLGEILKVDLSGCP